MAGISPMTFASGTRRAGDRRLQMMRVRVPPACASELGPLARAVARVAGLATTGEAPGVFMTLGRSRPLFRAWIGFAGMMLFGTRLPRMDVELVVLRTACNCCSFYEWAQHVPLALKAGLGADDIACVSRWPDGAGFTDRQADLLAATDELHEQRVVTDGTWVRLRSRFDDEELMELCMLVGHYEMLAMTLNSLGVEPDRRTLAILDESARRIGEELATALDGLAGGGGERVRREVVSAERAPSAQRS
jgi:alkylhydroperoxidase family enzyme